MKTYTSTESIPKGLQKAREKRGMSSVVIRKRRLTRMKGDLHSTSINTRNWEHRQSDASLNKVH